MKKIRTKALDFTKKNVLELNDQQSLEVNGGTSVSFIGGSTRPNCINERPTSIFHTNQIN